VRRTAIKSKAAPVWFTTSANNNRSLIQTGPETWKAKTHQTREVRLSCGSERGGPGFIGKAEITNDAAVVNKSWTGFPRQVLAESVMASGHRALDSTAVSASRSE